MNFISLPSGIIINMEQIAFISVPRKGEVDVAFCATYPAQPDVEGTPMKIVLKGQDAREFLFRLSSHEVDVQHAAAAFE